jgi:Putative ABC exporter
VRGALPWLFFTTRRNAVRRFLGGLRRPRRALGTLATAASIVVFVVFAARGSRHLPPETASSFLVTLLGITLLLGLASGLSERGIAFQPAEVDALFPGPFRPRSLVAYRAASEDLASVFGSILFFLLAGLATPRPWLAFVGALLCGATAVHVRLVVALLATQLGDRAFARLRGPARAVGLAAALALGILVIAAFTRTGGVRGAVVTVVDSPVARVFLYPAVAAGDLSRAESLDRALPPLVGALAACAGTLALLLALQVNFLEASVGATSRAAARRARQRRGARAEAPATSAPARSGRLPSSRPFGGAGAVAWRNALAARRSLRALVASALLVGVFLFPLYLGEGGLRQGLSAVVFAAMLPLFLSSTIAFDFRGQTGHLAELKALPVSASRLALAQVTVPTLLALLLQALFLGILAVAGRVPPSWLPLAFAAYAPTTAALVASTNLGWFVGARLRVAATLFQLLFLAALIGIVGGAYAALQALGAGPAVTVAGLLAVVVAAAAVSIRLVGAAFAAYDVSAT